MYKPIFMLFTLTVLYGCHIYCRCYNLTEEIKLMNGSTKRQNTNNNNNNNRQFVDKNPDILFIYVGLHQSNGHPVFQIDLR